MKLEKKKLQSLLVLFVSNVMSLHIILIEEIQILIPRKLV